MQEKRFDRGSFAQRDTRAAFIRLPDGRAGRASILRARTQADPEQQLVQGPEITILVAKSSAALDRMLARLRLLLAAVCGLATIVMLAMCGWIVRAALRPVNALARQIGGIGADDLAERIQPPDVPRELCPIVSRLNELLAKLEGAFHRERAFTADAAHELRTPLSGLQTALEVCSREPREAPQYRRVVDDCLKVVHQMNAMVDNLLMLARADGNQIPAAREMTDVGELLRETWSRYQPTIEHRRVRVELQVQEGLVVRTDREKLAMILSNLLENASRYVNDSGRLTISALFADGSVKLAVANSGSKLRPGEIDHVFERFWRGDSSRSAAGRNCGLGLAVCRKLAAVLGASITAECADSDQFVVRVSLPGAIPSSQTLQAVCT
jgi:heavy metal sensor kinase